MKKVITILIGFIHDFAAGCWVASVFAVYWLHRQQSGGESIEMIAKLQKQFFYMSLLSIVIVFAAGVGRSFTYVSNFYGEDAERARKRMLLIKHFFLLIIFGVGTYWQYSLIYL